MKAIDYVTELASIEGGRGAGTEGEAKASGLIQAWMKDAGFETRQESFKIMPSGFHTGFFDFFLLMAVAYILPVFGVNPFFSFLLAVVLCGVIAGEYTTHFTLSRKLVKLRDFPTSSNVIGEAGNRESSKTILLTAHYDSQKASPFTEAISRWGYLPWANALLFFGLLPFILFPFKVVWIISVVVFILLAGFFLYCDLTGSYVPGASDNASGVAGIIQAGKELATDTAISAEARIIIVATGAEETGMWGMDNFMRQHGPKLDKDKTLVINLDNVGAGSLELLHYELHPYFKYKRTEIDMAREAAGSIGLELNLTSHFLPTDGVVAIRDGFKALSFVAKDEGGKIMNYHTLTDVAENVDGELVETTAKITAQTARIFLKNLRD